MTKIKTVARACVVYDEKLLLVTNDGSYWYLPGGHQEPKETLVECVAREVYEETGLSVECSDVIYCSEFYDFNIGTHKVEVIFLARPKGMLPDTWQDVDDSVREAEFFSLADMEKMNIQPRYLKEGAWLNTRTSPLCYQGFESNE